MQKEYKRCSCNRCRTPFYQLVTEQSRECPHCFIILLERQGWFRAGEDGRIRYLGLSDLQWFHVINTLQGPQIINDANYKNIIKDNTTGFRSVYEGTFEEVAVFVKNNYDDRSKPASRRDV